MNIQIVSDKLSAGDLRQSASRSHGDMVKAVVDIQKEVMAVGGELHADAEALLLDQGSRQENLWGINLYPNKPEAQRIECHSLINIRPRQGNLSMEIQDATLRRQVKEIVNRRIEWDQPT